MYGGEWTVNAGQSTPYGIAAAANGEVYVTDSEGNNVFYYTKTGEYLGSWTYDGDRSCGVVISPDGSTAYVSDIVRDRVGIYSRTGTLSGYLGTGNSGSGNGDFDGPYEVAVALNGNVYVVDGNNNRIQYFTSDGQYLGQWGDYGSSEGQFQQPSGIGVAANGDVYVCEWYASRVQYFSATGDYLGGWGSHGDGFFYPTSVAVSPLNGDVFVAQWDLVQYFSAEGSFEGNIGTYGGPGGLVSAAGVCLSASGDTVYVTDPYDKKVKYYVKFEGQ
ncbi:MAG: hypothetical protein GY771_02940 [bacterium]|nr:hypothetical protein [bacterium]